MPYDKTKLDRSVVGSIEVDAGGGFVNLGAIREETIKVNGEEVEHINVQSYPIAADDTAFGKVSVEIDFTWEQIADPDLWNMILHGGTVAITTAGSQAVANEPVALSGINWKALVHAADFKFDSAVVVTHSSGSPTYVEGEDFYLDRKGGHIKRIATGDITDGQSVLVDYEYNTHAGKSFKIFDNAVPAEYAFRLTKPLKNNNILRIQHTKAKFSASMELGLNPGDAGAWAGVNSTLKFVKDDTGVYGPFGTWEIYTP